MSASPTPSLSYTSHSMVWSRVWWTTKRVELGLELGLAQEWERRMWNVLQGEGREGFGDVVEEEIGVSVL
ncbi:hypothetical protein VNO80_10174 [Phaseolus coccineus]|uniref:Uncharacterized protein n=1 Tax=Phaseolus coccineus TaxID=3886 RepID=A0AAN9RD81_PHACN